MRLYHGTDVTSASKILGSGIPPFNIKTNLGKGEMGQGFYVGHSRGLAISRAKAKGKGAKKGAVLEIDINNQLLASLNMLILTFEQVNHYWTEFKTTRQTGSFLFDTDGVYGPLATIFHSNQYKFESAYAEKILNNSPIVKIF